VKIAILYICVTGGASTIHYATRFIATLQAYPAGVDFDLIPVFNNGEPSSDIRSVLPHKINIVRSNEGYDIGAFKQSVEGVCRDYDAICCFGESVYFHRRGWLDKIVAAWQRHGPGMYGMLSSNLVRPHLQTTAFATSPKFLREFPRKIVTKDDRYGFEHGQHSFMNWLEMRGYPVNLVTFDGVYSKNFWRTARNINWTGDQSNCLVWCNHTDNYVKQGQKTQQFWEKAVRG